MDSIQQSLAVDERNEHYGLPVVLLPIQISREVRRVEIRYRGFSVAHQFLKKREFLKTISFIILSKKTNSNSRIEYILLGTFGRRQTFQSKVNLLGKDR